MRSITLIKSEISDIPGIFWSGEDPFKKPKIKGYEKSRITVSGEKASGSPTIDLDLANRELINDPVPDERRNEIFDSISSRVNTDGMEALAWYSSFHFKSSDWGIFIPVSSLYYLEQRVFRSASRSQERRLQMAFELLLEHELFHFATDYACAQWEIIVRSPLWSFLTHQRLQKNGCYLVQEEKMANAYMLRRFKQHSTAGAYRCASSFSRSQPLGYRDAEEAISEDLFEQGLAELLKYYLGVLAIRKGIRFLSGVLDLSRSFPLGEHLDVSACPIHLISDHNQLGVPPLAVRLIQSIPRIEETKAFKKSLKSMQPDVRQQWAKKKQQLAEHIPTAPKFERFRKGPPPVYSVRLPRAHRAHITPVDNGDHWEAIGIGSHAKMGHG